MRKNALFSWRNLKNSFGLISSSEKIEGVIESFTTVHNAPKDFEAQVPYALALIILNNGKKVTAQIVDCKEVSIGMRVEPCVRRIYSDEEDGLIYYGTKFRVIK